MSRTSVSDQSQKSPTETARLYLDNAATSWPKPRPVIDAIKGYYRDNGTPAYRGTSGQSSGTDQGIERCRQKLADILGTNDKDEIVFAFNGTDALNMAILGTLGPGDHVVTTSIEHNSVLRPLSHLAKEKQVEVTIVGVQQNGVVDPNEVVAAVRPDTKLVCVSHVSNVTGVVQPVQTIGEQLRDQPVMFLVDAAQSLGHIKVDVEEIGCDFLAAPGHKGLYGPLGTGILYLAKRSWQMIAPLRFGGTGTQSDLDIQPEVMPTRFESGNLNVGGILGLEAGLDFVFMKTVSEISRNSSCLAGHAIDRLAVTPGVKIYCLDAPERTGVFSFNVSKLDPREVASILESSFGMQLRAGLHCSPRIHQELGTFETGGTVRVSLGCFNTIDEMDMLVSAVAEIASAM